MKKEHDGLTFQRGDAVAITAVVTAALVMIALLLIPSGGNGRVIARIYQDGEVIRELRLEENTEITVEGAYRNTISVRDGKIAFTHSDCPGEDCVHSGWISAPGRSAVCLPNRVEIRLEGEADTDDVDAVVQ